MLHWSTRRSSRSRNRKRQTHGRNSCPTPGPPDRPRWFKAPRARGRGIEPRHFRGGECKGCLRCQQWRLIRNQWVLGFSGVKWLGKGARDQTVAQSCSLLATTQRFTERCAMRPLVRAPRPFQFFFSSPNHLELTRFGRVCSSRSPPQHRGNHGSGQGTSWSSTKENCTCRFLHLV